MCPKFCTNAELKYTKCRVSTNLSNFIKPRLLYCQNLFALALTNRQFAEKNQLIQNSRLVIGMRRAFAMLRVSNIFLEF